MGITAHWMTNDWKLKHTVLEFCYLESSHSGENIALKFFEVLNEYNILTKVNKYYNL